METVLIIGSGYVGLSLALKLKEAGYKVSLTTTATEKQQQLKQQGLNVMIFNTETDSDYNQFDQLQVDYLIFTLPPSVCKTRGYKKTLEIITQSLKFHTILFTSSISVYLNNSKVHTEESKDVVESSAVKETEDYILARFRNYYIFRLAGLIDDQRHPKNFHKTGVVENANQLVNLVQVTDVAEVMTRSLSTKIPFGIYNVCSPMHPTKKEYYQQYNSGLTFTTGADGKIIDSTRLATLTGHEYKSIYL